jgi:hypothetical protein
MHVFVNAVPISQKTESISIINTDLPMLLGGTVALDSENHMKPISPSADKMKSF